MDSRVLFGNSTARRMFAAVALAALAILAYHPVCDAYETVFHQADDCELCCSTVDTDSLVPPAASAVPAGDEPAAPDLGILVTLVPPAVPRRLQGSLAGASPPLALGSYSRRSARLLR
jgi:hypothetical protein